MALPATTGPPVPGGTTTIEHAQQIHDLLLLYSTELEEAVRATTISGLFRALLVELFFFFYLKPIDHVYKNGHYYSWSHGLYS